MRLSSEVKIVLQKRLLVTRIYDDPFGPWAALDCDSHVIICLNLENAREPIEYVLYCTVSREKGDRRSAGYGQAGVLVFTPSG